MHRPRLTEFGRGTGSKLSSSSGPSLLLFFLVKFQLTLPVLLSQAMEIQIIEAMRSFLFQFSFKARTVFYLPAALQHAGMAKASRKCCRRKAFGSSLNVYHHFLMPGLSWTGQLSLCGVAPVPLD